MDRPPFTQLGYRGFPLPFGQKAPPPRGWRDLAGRIAIPDSANYGLTTEDFSVVDIDEHALIDRFERRYHGCITTIVETPSGNRHYYFRGEARNQQNDGWDVRGVGGYVVGPGSLVDGKVYRLLTALQPIAALKLFPDELRRGARTSKGQGVTNDTFSRIARAKAYGAKVICIEHKRAHNTLFRFCCWMRDIGLTMTEAYAILLDWNHMNCFCEDGVTPYPFSQRELTHKLEDAFAGTV